LSGFALGIFERLLQVSNGLFFGGQVQALLFIGSFLDFVTNTVTLFRDLLFS